MNGLYVIPSALNQKKQLELFEYLKPYLETQAVKTHKSGWANVMIGLGLRLDMMHYNVNIEPFAHLESDDSPKHNIYAYYDKSRAGEPLGQITTRMRELIENAISIDMSNYDSALVNIYSENEYVTAHIDDDESSTANKYPVISVNIGGDGIFGIIPETESTEEIINLTPGTVYAFGINGENRYAVHRTLPSIPNGFLPELRTLTHGIVYPFGSYRISITFRRVMPLGKKMAKSPKIISNP